MSDAYPDFVARFYDVVDAQVREGGPLDAEPKEYVVTCRLPVSSTRG